MIKLTDHVQLRYVQRFLGITDEWAAREYVKLNADEIRLALWDLCAEGKIIMKDKVKNKQKGIVNDYLISNDCILVVDSSTQALITLYTIGEFGNKRIKNPHGVIRQIIHTQYNIEQIKKNKQKKDEERKQSTYSILQLEKMMSDIGEQSYVADHINKLKITSQELAKESMELESKIQLMEFSCFDMFEMLKEMKEKVYS